MESIILQRRRDTAGKNGGALAALAELCDYKNPRGPTPFLHNNNSNKTPLIPFSLTVGPPSSIPTASAASSSSSTWPIHQQSSYISVIADHHHRAPPADAPTPVTPRSTDSTGNPQTLVREILSASLSLAELSKSPVVFNEDQSQPVLQAPVGGPLTRMPSLSSASESSSVSSSSSSSLSTNNASILAPSTISIEPRTQTIVVSETCTSTNKPIVKRALEESTSSSNPSERIRFREYQVTTWSQRLEDVQAFVRKHGHCMIPSDYPPNQKLAKWAKRQRCQYQLFQSNPSKSSMTSERIRVLEELGFCWQNKMSVWQARYQELLQFHLQFGHTQVPSSYKPNQRLATWVKCQRRQKRLRDRGRPSSMTDDRIALLNSVHFVWRMYPSSPRGDE